MLSLKTKFEGFPSIGSSNSGGVVLAFAMLYLGNDARDRTCMAITRVNRIGGETS